MKPHLILSLLLLAAPLMAQVRPVPMPRTALLIGAWNYTDPGFPPLPQTGIEHDLDSMKTALEGLGFTVTVEKNPTLGEAKIAVDAFSAAVKTRGGTSLFYFTGHGAEHEGVNYLIPTRTSIGDAADLNHEALTANRILNRMESAETMVNLLFLDCCRNGLTKSGGGAGFAPMTAKGCLIGFATRSGDVAGTTTSGSPYTKALVARLAMPALSLPDMHTLVTQDLEASSANQRPGSYVDLGGIFQMTPGTVPTLLASMAPRSGGVASGSPADPAAEGTSPGSAPPAPTPFLATKVEPLVNSLGMKFVPVPGTKVLFCISRYAQCRLRGLRRG